MSTTHSVQHTYDQALADWVTKWNDFSKDQRAMLCKWIGTDEECLWVDTFFERENTIHRKTNDAFTKLSTPFLNLHQYEADVVKEFQQWRASFEEQHQTTTETNSINTRSEAQVLEDKEPPSLAQKETNKAPKRKSIQIRKRVKIVKRQVDIPSFANSPLYEELSSFANKLPQEFHHLIVYVKPKKIAHLQDWISWISGVLQHSFPSNIKWMLVDSSKTPVLKNLNSQYFDNVYEIKAEIDTEKVMKALMKQVELEDDPASRFKRHFMQMTEAAEQWDVEELEKHKEMALSISEKEKWTHLQSTVYLTVAGAYLQMKEFTYAKDIYDDTFHFSKQSYEAGEIVSGKLAIQALLGKANCHISMKHYDRAIMAYEDAADMAEKLQDSLLLMEAYRLMGLSFEKMGDLGSAWEVSYSALNIGKELDDQSREGSTFPNVGQQLLRLCQKMGKGGEVSHIQITMEERVGKDWEDKVVEDS